VVAITSLVVADPPELWNDLGFVVRDRACRVAGITIELGAPAVGLSAWTLDDAAGLSELPVARGVSPQTGATAPHSNHVIALDHIVVATPDVGRTIEAFETAGIPLRRTREIGTPQQPTIQAFFRLDNTVVEVVGPARESRPGPARFYGLAFTVADLDATATLLGGRLRPAKDAVQPGRRIATLDRAAGSTVPIAFMSPLH
jgi:hypothetical protein